MICISCTLWDWRKGPAPASGLARQFSGWRSQAFHYTDWQGSPCRMCPPVPTEPTDGLPPALEDASCLFLGYCSCWAARLSPWCAFFWHSGSATKSPQILCQPSACLTVRHSLWLYPYRDPEVLRSFSAPPRFFSIMWGYKSSAPHLGEGHAHRCM